MTAVKMGLMVIGGISGDGEWRYNRRQTEDDALLDFAILPSISLRIGVPSRD